MVFPAGDYCERHVKVRSLPRKEYPHQELVFIVPWFSSLNVLLGFEVGISL